MIDRYTRPEMGAIWELENKYAIWQKVEVAACEAQAELGKIGITKEEAAWISEHAAFNKEEVDQIEAITTSLPSSRTWVPTSTPRFPRETPSLPAGCTTA